MPRVYKPKPGAQTRKKYDENVIKQALEELASTTNVSISSVAKKYGISKSVLGRHKLYNMKSSGGQTVLSMEAEEYIVQNLNACAEWGYPLTTMDLRHIVKMFLDTKGIEIKRFKNNFPGPDFVEGFLKRHKDKISKRICQNIKRSRAAVSHQIINDYFVELEKCIKDIPASNIINYDETNLSDDPGRKQVIVRRGCKYPERIMNHTKGSISIMMAATADGEILPPYVVYRANHLYNTWVANGPNNVRYNRSKSGWFDGEIFADWVKMTVIPILENKPGRKVLIGDNLSSHLSADLIKLCKEKNIDFIFLPANSTHITQPLDVAFFRPMKAIWRNILEKWKRTDGRTLSTIPKGCFPRLLKLLMDQLKINSESNIKAGFRKTGIFPLDVNQILSRLPQLNEEVKEAIDGSFVQLLKEMRFGTMEIKEPKTKRKLEVVPGRSVSGEEAKDQVKEDIIPAKKIKETQVKGKGKGKKSKQINEENTEDMQNIKKARDGEIQKESQEVHDKQNGNLHLEETKDTEKENGIHENVITQMPIFFADNLDCQEIIVSGEEAPNQEKEENIPTKKIKKTDVKGKGKKSKQFNKKNAEAMKNECKSTETAKNEEIQKEAQDVVHEKMKSTEMEKETQEHVMSQMPIFFADDLDYQEIIVSSETITIPSEPNTSSFVLQEAGLNTSDTSKMGPSKQSKVNILSNKQIKKPIKKCKKNFYNEADEIMKILLE